MQDYTYLPATPESIVELEKIKAEFLLEKARISAKNEKYLQHILVFFLGAVWCWTLFYLGVFKA